MHLDVGDTRRMNGPGEDSMKRKKEKIWEKKSILSGDVIPCPVEERIRSCVWGVRTPQIHNMTDTPESLHWQEKIIFISFLRSFLVSFYLPFHLLLLFLFFHLFTSLTRRRRQWVLGFLISLSSLHRISSGSSLLPMTSSTSFAFVFRKRERKNFL